MDRNGNFYVGNEVIETGAFGSWLVGFAWTSYLEPLVTGRKAGVGGFGEFLCLKHGGFIFRVEAGGEDYSF